VSRKELLSNALEVHPDLVPALLLASQILQAGEGITVRGILWTRTTLIQRLDERLPTLARPENVLETPEWADIVRRWRQSIAQFVVGVSCS
jgi:hypothetical protein